MPKHPPNRDQQAARLVLATGLSLSTVQKYLRGGPVNAVSKRLLDAASKGKRSC